MIPLNRFCLFIIATLGVGRASVELFTLAYFDNRQVDADAIVMDVRVDGLTVFVKEFGIEVRTHVVFRRLWL